jgi:hypothetical protein
MVRKYITSVIIVLLFWLFCIHFDNIYNSYTDIDQQYEVYKHEDFFPVYSIMESIIANKIKTGTFIKNKDVLLEYLDKNFVKSQNLRKRLNYHYDKNNKHITIDIVACSSLLKKYGNLKITISDELLIINDKSSKRIVKKKFLMFSYITEKEFDIHTFNPGMKSDKSSKIILNYD